MRAPRAGPAMTAVPRPAGGHRGPAHPLATLHGAAGNGVVQRILRARLKVSQPGDRYEQEADRVAGEVLQRRPAPCSCGGTCGDCAATGTVQRKATGSPGATMPPRPAVGLGPGRPLEPPVRAFFESRFGTDLGAVRVHADREAGASAEALQSRAYAVGTDLVFGPGEYAPSTSDGLRLLAHELAHAIQQGGAPPAAAAHGAGVSVQRVADAPFVARVTKAMCSEVGAGLDCDLPDGAGAATGKNTLTVYADKEGPFLLLPFTHKVGHSWVKLTDSSGSFWTFGFWPQEGFRPSDLSADVEGCVHHPDTAHTPTASQTFELTDAEFAAAKATAISICHTTPKYNLFGLQCTDFVRRVLEAAGRAPALGFGLIWESPNALDTWIRGNALLLGVSFTAAASRGETGFGTAALDVSYTHRFYSALGEKLRLHWISRGEVGPAIKSISTGIGAELTTQRVYLPSLYVYGAGVAGELRPSVPGLEEKLGAGVTGGAGLLYNVDEFGAVGVEYNVVKDLVNRDPELHRLMVTAKLKLF